MSTSYGLDFDIRTKSKKQAKAIIAAIKPLWTIAGHNVSGEKGKWWITAWGEDNLSLGQKPLDEYLEGIYEAIKKANGEDLEVEITVRYIEQVPTDSYTFGSSDGCWCSNDEEGCC